MHDLPASLRGRRRVSDSMWVLEFWAPAIALEARAGQFVNLLLRPGPLLRRPFSVFDVDAESVQILLAGAGTGTRLLLQMREGDTLSMLGPLGRGFELDAKGGPVALVSGGLGVAPMPLAAREAAGLGLAVHWVHGARTGSELCTQWRGDEVHWATDDGSKGRRGSVLDSIPEAAEQILACGPNRMLGALAARHPSAQVALETYMACGTGVCLACAVPRVSGGYDRACTEGPVYRGADVLWAALPVPARS